jgi:hypothetical protein
MHLTRGTTLVLYAVIFAGLLACRTSEVFIAQATITSTPTRTARPSFTPVPSSTSTVVPTVPPPPTAARTATKRPPTPRPPTPKPPTAVPQPVAPAGPTQPPKSAYEFKFIPRTCEANDPDGPCNSPGGIWCHHSGSKHIKVVVFNDVHDPNSQRQGGKVRYSISPDGSAMDPDEITQWNGVAEKTLSADQDPPSKGDGTYYAWVINDNGQRISDMSPQIRLNAKDTDAPDFCMVATLFFAAGN